MTLGLILLVGGLLQSAWAAWAIRTDASKDHVSLIEGAILKLTESDPSPGSRVGLAFDRVMEWIALLFGLVFLVAGFLILLAEFS
jgi:hypothetical protein